VIVQIFSIDIVILSLPLDMRKKKEYFFTTPYPVKPAAMTSAEEKVKHDKHFLVEMDINVLIVTVMDPRLQREFINYDLDVMSIIDRLKNMFQEKAHVERAELIKVIAYTTLAEGGQVGQHLMKMVNYFCLYHFHKVLLKILSLTLFPRAIMDL
jgi:hypothetical protein